MFYPVDFIQEFVYLFFVSVFSPSEIMQNNPRNIMTAPIHHTKFVSSLKIKHPRSAEIKKFDAVEMTVGTNVLVSFE